MPPQILLNPQFAAIYLGQFAARPDKGRIEVPVLLHPEAPLSLRKPLATAVRELGEGYLDQAKTMLRELSATLDHRRQDLRPGGEFPWVAVGSDDTLAATFIHQTSSNEHPPRIRLSAERLGSRLQVEMSFRGIHSQRIMSQEIISRQGRLLCMPPLYGLFFAKSAVKGLRHFLGLPESAPLREVGLAVFPHLGFRNRPTPVENEFPPEPVTDPTEIGSIGHFGFEGTNGGRKTKVTGELEVKNLEEEIFDEHMNVWITPQSPDRGALTPKMLGLWDHP